MGTAPASTLLQSSRPSVVASLIVVFLLSVVYWVLPLDVDIVALLLVDGVGVFLGLLLGYRAARLKLPFVSSALGIGWRLVAGFFFAQALAEVGLKTLHCLLAEPPCEDLGSAVRTGNNFAWILAEYWLVLSGGFGAGFALHQVIGVRPKKATNGGDTISVIRRILWILLEALIAALVAAAVAFGFSRFRDTEPADKAPVGFASDEAGQPDGTDQ